MLILFQLVLNYIYTHIVIYINNFVFCYRLYKNDSMHFITITHFKSVKYLHLFHFVFIIRKTYTCNNYNNNNNT